MEDREKLLGNEKIPSLLRKLSIPATLANVCKCSLQHNRYGICRADE